jgi:hypothetical protein
MSKDKRKKVGGTKVIENLAKDLKTSFPQMAGFSPRNLFYMKQFAEAYPEFSILQQAVAKIPWVTTWSNRRPIGVARYTTKLMETLPKNLKSSLPTIEEIESKLVGI